MEWKLGIPLEEGVKETTPEANASPAPGDSTSGTTTTTTTEQSAAASEATSTAAATTTETAKLNDDELIKLVNERGGVSLAKLDDLKTTFESAKTQNDQITELNKQLETLSKKEPEFKSDKAKALYEYANKHEGFELAAAKNLLNVVGLDLDKADPKQLQFEAFALQYPNYPREEAKAIFDAKYEKTYGDGTAIATDPLLKFEHDQATSAARQSIASTVKNYIEAKSPEPQKQEAPAGPTPEQLEAVKRGVESGLKDFKGSTFNLPEYKTKEGQVVPASALNLEMKPEEVTKLKGYMENPEAFLRDVIGRFKGEKGMDWNGLANTMALMQNLAFNPQEFYAKIQSQSVEKGMLIILNKIKNEGGQQQSPEAGGDGTQKKSFREQFNETRKTVDV